MSNNIGLWRVNPDGPSRLNRTEVDLERDLEDWIERDPALIQAGMTIVGRQIHTAGGPLDLLGIDNQGRLVVIEIKRGQVRRDTVAQALDYASCIARMPFVDLAEKTNRYLVAHESPSFEEILTRLQGEVDRNEALRTVDIFVVGTKRDPGLQRIIDYLADTSQVNLTVVCFDVFDSGHGSRLLTRELTDAAPAEGPSRAKAGVTLEQVLTRAAQMGTEEHLRRIVDTAIDLGLHLRPWKTSVMFAPAAKKTRCLFTVWTDQPKGGGLTAYVALDAFNEFYGIETGLVLEKLSIAADNVTLPLNGISAFLQGLAELLQEDGEPE